MDIDIEWHRPIQLVDGQTENLIYTAKKGALDSWQGVAGVYMFCRMFNGEASPLYIGKAENIAGRISQHFKNNTRLMNSIRNAANGTRVVIPGKFIPKRGQNKKRCIAIVERALIDHALAEGYELFNIQGARTATHSIGFSGFLGARNITRQRINAKIEG